MKKISSIFATAAVFFLSGCAPQIENSLASFKNLGKSSNFQNETKNRYDYETLAKKYKEENKTFDLLWDYEAGVINQNIKDYKQSNYYFDIAENMIKKYDKEIMASKALANIGSLLTNDTFLDYSPKIYEKIMVNTLKGINFMALNDKQNARIEFNRALVRQQRAKIFFKKEIEKIRAKMRKENEKKMKKNKNLSPSIFSKVHDKKTREAIDEKYKNLFAFKAYPDFVNPFTTYLSALYFYNIKDYRKAADLFKESYAMIKGLDRGDKVVKKDWILALKAKRSIKQRRKHYTWVIFLNGEGPVKKEIRIDIPLFLISNKINYTGIALPTLKMRSKAYKNLKISNQKRSVFTKTITSMDRIVKTEFKKRFPTIVTRALFRTITQTVLQKQINDKANKMGSATLGFLTKFAGTAYQVIMNRADTRIWDRLPKEFQVARIKTRRKISIFAGDKKISDIKTNPHKNYIIFVKIPKKETKPIIYKVAI